MQVGCLFKPITVQRTVVAFCLLFLVVIGACNQKNKNKLVKQEPTIFFDSTMLVPRMRFYGEQTIFKPSTKVLGDDVSIAVGELGATLSEVYRPKALTIGPPLIEPRGLVKGRGFLYISDSGHDENHDEPATIWRLDPNTGKLNVFYRGSLLVNSKWLWFVEGSGGKPDELLISDFGQESSLHREGNGIGAKVFAIQVLTDGSAGPIRVLHEGPPFRDPQGITVVGETVIVADTRAGEVRSRIDAPHVKFSNGVVFALPLKGGKPVRLFSDQLFVTLVGSCAYFDGEDLYLRFWDIDGGRQDTSKFAWMPHSGFSQLKKTRVESVNPLKFGPVEVVPFIEEFPINLKFAELKSTNTVSLRGINGTTLAGGSENLVLKSSGGTTLIAESPTTESNLIIEATIFDGEKPIFGPRRIEFPKDVGDLSSVARDNKHAGARLPIANFVDATVDGISKTVGLFPRQGGIMTFLWQGAPLSTPMASQPSWDETKLYVTDLDGGPDGTGAVWEFRLPSEQQISLMYSAGNAWKILNKN